MDVRSLKGMGTRFVKGFLVLIFFFFKGKDISIDEGEVFFLQVARDVWCDESGRGVSYLFIR